MPSMTQRQTHVLLATAALLGCGGDLTLPAPSAEGVALTIVDGDGQTGTVGEELPRPLVVGVQSDGAPVRDHVIAFSIVAAPAGVDVEPDTVSTGEDGRAVAHVELGPEAGAYEIEAKLVVSDPQPPPSAVFDGAAVAGAPDTLRSASPIQQPGRRGEEPPDAPTVLVLDRFGNPVAGAAVQWEVTAGGGEVSGGTTTDAAGRAAATWTLGTGTGVQKVQARVEGAAGSPLGFTAFVLF